MFLVKFAWQGYEQESSHPVKNDAICISLPKNNRFVVDKMYY